MSEAVIREPFFTFNVWQCRRCGNVVTNKAYMLFVADFPCTCGERLSTYRFVEAKVSPVEARRQGEEGEGND